MKSVLVLLTIVLALPVQAQQWGGTYRHYRGGKVDRVWDWGRSHAAWQVTAYCLKQYQNDLPRQLVCSAGATFGDQHAHYCATGHGRVAGYLAGYSWGTDYGFTQILNNPARTERFEERGADEVRYMTDRMRTGLDASQQKGANEGGQDGSRLAIDNFRAAVAQAPNRGQLPARQAPAPNPTWQGEENAYTKYNIGPFPEDGRFYLQDAQITNFRWAIDREIWDLEARCPWFDYDRNRQSYWGSYRFNDSYWAKSNVAFDKWVKYNRNAYDVYANHVINGVAADARHIFKMGFTTAYEHRADHSFSCSFHDNLDRGAEHGVYDGEICGERFAQDRGKIREYNRVFKERSRQRYGEGYGETFADGFYAAYDDYSANPKLEITFRDLIGVRNDNMIMPGEKVRAQFQVINFGGQGSAISAIGTGRDLQNVTAQQNLSPVDALQVKSYTTDFLGEVSSRLNSGNTADLALLVNDRRLNMSVTAEYPGKILSSQNEINVNRGNGAFHVKVQNSSRHDSTASFEVALYVNNVRADLQNTGGILAGGQTTTVRVNFADVDPLQLITSSVPVRLELSSGGVVFERKEFSISAAGDRVVVRLADYFNALANNAAYVPSAVNPVDQLRQVATLLRQHNERELNANKEKKDPNVWEGASVNNQTVVGVISRQYTASSQSQAAKEEYNDLARALADDINRVMTGKKTGARREAYISIVSTFSTVTLVARD